jgi:hypothetical protein
MIFLPNHSPCPSPIAQSSSNQRRPMTQEIAKVAASAIASIQNDPLFGAGALDLVADEIVADGNADAVMLLMAEKH